MTLYMPGVRPRASYRPLWSAVRLSVCCGPWSVTFALGTAAPVGSFTYPARPPLTELFCCATANARVLYDGLEANGERYTLVDANKRAVFFGRLRLSHAARSRTQAFFFYPRTPNAKCTAPERCNEFCRIYSSVFDEKEDPWMNPFYRLNWKSIRSTCCNVCAARWERHYESATRELWGELPRLFDLEPWAELERRAKAA